MPHKPPATEPVFFVDRSLGGKWVVEALRKAGAQVVVHDEVFPQNATDVEWLEEAGRRGWVVLTKDGNIRRNPHEKAMFREAGVKVFALARQNLPGTVEPPFIFSISRKVDFRRLD